MLRRKRRKWARSLKQIGEFGDGKYKLEITFVPDSFLHQWLKFGENFLDPLFSVELKAISSQGKELSYRLAGKNLVQIGGYLNLLYSLRMTFPKIAVEITDLSGAKSCLLPNLPEPLHS